MPGKGKYIDNVKPCYKIRCTWHGASPGGVEHFLSSHVIKSDCTWHGASQDVVEHYPDCPYSNGLHEIKCPYNYRESSSFHAATQKRFCCQLEEGKTLFSENYHYYYQVQGQLDVCS